MPTQLSHPSDCLCDARTPTIVPSLFAVKPTVSDPMIIYGKCIKTVTCTTTSRGFIPSVVSDHSPIYTLVTCLFYAFFNQSCTNT